MTRQRVIQFEYLQSLLQDSDQPGWSEDVSVSVRILSEALTSGWYRERFASRGNDFVILLTIAMHAPHPNLPPQKNPCKGRSKRIAARDSR